jgi:hypothetical protein
MKPIPHVPYVGDFDGLLDVFSVCNIMEASNILHHKSYHAGTKGLTADDRMQMIHGRIRARQILAWVFTNYAFEGDILIETFYWRYLAHQLKTLTQIKERIEWQDVNTFNSCTAEAVKEKIKQTFAGLNVFQNAWESLPEDEIMDLEAANSDGEGITEVSDTNPKYARKLKWSLNERYKVVVRHAEPENTCKRSYT